MSPFGIIVADIGFNSLARGFWRFVLHDVDVLPFDGSPKTLGNCVIKSPASAVHTDFDAVFF